MKNVVRKRPGRPATGQDPVTAIRLSSELRKSVDAWAAKQEDLPGRSEAIRRLVELGLGRALSFARPATRAGGASADRAKELAEKTIDRLADPETSSEEKVVRRRRLVKGPSEFREDRLDQPRPKKR
ncbi:hypothetical protein GGD63_006544 [Bradyrhizobium sp. cir1]|uniref:hypothetical protein n=1 Tax=Bradyrhizobium sp. cir1 TaxID=1445730 RepID=UPI00160586C9|nr:hypothetical protein [Bradyrhizobium sp. cir1]MBB4373716.1 hypothetical protein [Bradyrhizobium sp. cir1]